MFFDGTLDPAGGRVRPDSHRPGNGLALRAGVAGRYRVGKPVTRRLTRSGESV